MGIAIAAACLCMPKVIWWNAKLLKALAIDTQYNLFALAFLVIKTYTIGRDRSPKRNRRDIILSSLIYPSPSKGYSRGLGYP